MNEKLDIYLASPYWHKEPIVRQSRVIFSRLYAWYLQEVLKKAVFSPLSYSTSLTDFGVGNSLALERSEKEWLNLVMRFLPLCEELHVLRLPGVDDSKGVKAELAEWGTLGMGGMSGIQPFNFIDIDKVFIERFFSDVVDKYEKKNFRIGLFGGYLKTLWFKDLFAALGLHDLL